MLAERLAADRERVQFEQARAAQVQHHFRHAAGQEDLHGGMDRAARSAAHRPGAAPAD